MRGIYTAAFLDRLVAYFARSRGETCLDLGKGFDLITGTSTGAIVACALERFRSGWNCGKLFERRGSV